MVMRYESIRGELSLPALQELGQNCFGIPEKGAEWAVSTHPRLDYTCHCIPTADYRYPTL